MYHIVRHMTERHLARAAVSLLSEAIMYRLLPPLLYHAVDGSRARLHMVHRTLESSEIRLHLSRKAGGDCCDARNHLHGGPEFMTKEVLIKGRGGTV